ncbi:fumarylacetoacetate hydrolase family protein [Agarivorans sp. MS3-6]|uniref:fumarylacetoacetate hydrolase family protein n=1 Tax=Agarivorans sp. TSD2052 TaxID=2937286 RepID=UPI00200D7F46|nr:fumarylacetoacetate hydrolase family protein [Agarivorans sp. TSD2052]UPW16703.1 fumarylacetoacetate hydrolase family protein [Agarivorans sp. TSD2052]
MKARRQIYLSLMFSSVITSYSHANDYALIEGEQAPVWVQRSGQLALHLDASPLDGGEANGQSTAIDDAKFLLPIKPATVFAVGLNYRSHAGDSGAAKPEIFFKSASSLSIGGSLLLPKDANNVHFEGELVLVIGKTCSKVNKEQALACVFAYTSGNDLTERSWQGRDLQWWRAKGADGFAPISQWLTSDIDPSDLTVTTRLNGAIVQQESTKNMIHSVEDIVSYISGYVTLQPWDVIFTGTPGRTQALKKGDKVSVAVSSLNQVVTNIE